MRRRQLLLGVGTLGFAGILCAWLAYPRHGVDKESLAQVQEGMTLAEVEEVLGGPPGDYTRGRYAVKRRWFYPPGTGHFIDLNHLEDLPQVHCWVGEEYAIEVWFSKDRVGFVECREVVPVPGWPRNYLRRLLPW